MIQAMLRVSLLALAATVLACSSLPAQQPTGGDAAARVGTRTITLKELDDRWRADNAADHAEVNQKLYDGRRAALDAIVAEMLITEAAKAKGVAPDAYTTEEVTRRTKPVTDADVVSFFQANQGQMQGRPLDMMSAPIKGYLEERARDAAREDLLAELRKGGPAVSLLLDAPRVQVDVAATDPALGGASAPVTLVEFSDFQCPFCQRVEPTLKQIRDKYGDKVRIVWKDFPLTQIHPQAFKASEAAHCAGDQGKFWEYHDRLFANQQALQLTDLKAHAAALGLNAATFDACLDGSKYAERVRDGVAAGSRLGVNSTPTSYVNGRMLSGSLPFEAFSAVIDEELAKTAR
jgi:protein-disulfide isomerase